MDRSLLDHLAAEVDASCTGGVVHRVIPRPSRGIALIFTERDRPALDLAPGPPRPRLAATRRRLESAGDANAQAAAVAASRLRGRRLSFVEMWFGDRLARLRFEGGGELVLEVLGPRANLYLLGEDRRVVARFRATGRPGGELGEGMAWTPPAPGSSRERDSGPGGGWCPPAAGCPPRPGLAAPGPDEALDPLQPLSGGELQLRCDGPEENDAFFLPAALLGDALVQRDAWLRRHEAAARRLQAWQGTLRRERLRLERLRSNLDREIQEASSHPDLRRGAEAILAGLAVAERRGNRLLVPDPYDEDGRVLEVLVDPARSDQANAELLFRRAGRLRRAQNHVQEKRERLAKQLASLAALESRLEAVERLADLEALDRQRPRWLRAARGTAKSRSQSLPDSKAGRPSVRQKRLEKDPRARRIRRFVLGGQWHTLVGGGAAANDFLTFRMAAAHDFWLHAADYPGAHVVVRNPGRRGELPPVILRQAAALAAHFSRAPGPGPVAVRWTQARHVRKGRGLPPGTVLLPRFLTISVLAALPPAREPDPEA
jgi:predicted ribosome quality control (RQC) complex YloA/Tae2 family protein